MTRWILAASAAALALAAPGISQGQGGGRGGGNDKGQKAQGNKGGGPKAERGGGPAMRPSGPDRGPRMMADRGRPDKARGSDKARSSEKARGPAVVFDKGNNGNGNRGNGRATDLVRIRDDVRFRPGWNDGGLVRGFGAGGCPPGLAKKGNGCMPPGQAKKIVGTALPAALTGSLLSPSYRSWYRDDDDFFYRGDGDYIYRVRRDGGLIDALFPSHDRDYYYYPVGAQYPMDYNYYNVPWQYRSYYPDGGDNWYRYGDGAIYSVNPSNGLISGIVSLLAGDLAVGQPLPQPYGVYNVPMSYRDRYYDSPDAWYRYNDGYIYRVDPKTQLITAVINALV